MLPVRISGSNPCKIKDKHFFSLNWSSPPLWKNGRVYENFFPSVIQSNCSNWMIENCNYPGISFLQTKRTILSCTLQLEQVSWIICTFHLYREQQLTFPLLWTSHSFWADESHIHSSCAAELEWRIEFPILSYTQCETVHKFVL